MGLKDWWRKRRARPCKHDWDAYTIGYTEEISAGNVVKWRCRKCGEEI
jgi:hypothetical protein